MNPATLSVFQGYNSFYQAKQIKLRKIFSTNMLTLEKFASSTTMFNQCHGILKLMKVFTLPLKKQKNVFLSQKSLRQYQFHFHIYPHLFLFPFYPSPQESVTRVILFHFSLTFFSFIYRYLVQQINQACFLTQSRK